MRLGLALFLLLPLSLAAKQPPLDYHPPPPDPPGAGQIDHASPGQSAAPPIASPLVGPGSYRNLPAIDESLSVKLPVSTQPYWSFGKVDPVLSEACQLGDFVTLPLNRIILQFAGKEGRAVMQVVPPLYRHLLVDRRSLARPGVTYYFFDTMLPSCEVRVDANVVLRSFPGGRGSALPPADRNALQRRLALIRSWPK